MFKSFATGDRKRIKKYNVRKIFCFFYYIIGKTRNLTKNEYNEKANTSCWPSLTTSNNVFGNDEIKIKTKKNKK